MKSYIREGSDNFYIQRCDNNNNYNDDNNSTNNTVETKDDSCETDKSDKKDKHKKNDEDDKKCRKNDGCADEALYLFHYPNLCVNRYGHWMDTNIVWPHGVDKCIVEFEWFVHKDFAGDSDYIEKAIAQSETVQTEDITLCNRYVRHCEQLVPPTSVYWKSICNTVYVLSTIYSHIWI